MKFLKSTLVIISILALTYTSSASKLSVSSLSNDLKETTSAKEKNSNEAQITFNGEVKNQSTNIETGDNNPSPSLPLNGDILFAFTAIASLSGYLIFKR